MSRVGFDSLSQLRNVLVERAAVGEVVLTPGMIEDRVTVECPTSVGVQQLQDGDVTGTQFDDGLAAVGSKLSGDDLQMSI